MVKGTPPYGDTLAMRPTEWGARLGVSSGCAQPLLADGTGGYRGVYKHPRALYTNLTHSLIYFLATG